MNEPIHNKDTALLTADLTQLIEESRKRVAVSVNAELTALYWHVGRRIGREALGNTRAGYGLQVIKALSIRLTQQYGPGWSDKQLRHCIQFADVFPDEQTVSTLWRQLSWSHLKEIIYLAEPLKREFYLTMCIHERWSVRAFRERIQSLLYERTAISRKPEATISAELQKVQQGDAISPDLVFRDPYVLDFLGLADTYSEQDLESAILAELQRFITEMGTDFAFLARQKRITIDNRDYRIDLLFYHRRLRRLVAIDLKLGEFEAGFKGQMELYLRWLEKHEHLEGEEPPLGLILCTGKNEEHIELLQLHQSNIRVAEYLTVLPPLDLLREKLHLAISIARERMENNE